MQGCLDKDDRNGPEVGNVTGVVTRKVKLANFSQFEMWFMFDQCR